MRPARGDYPCKVCGEVLHSPGALGCKRCHVDFDLGTTNLQASKVMDAFFAEHAHATDA